MFFNIKSTVHFKFIQQGQTVNQAYYMETLKLCTAYYMETLKLCTETGLKFGPMIGFSTMTMLQLKRHSQSSSFWSKNYYSHGTPTLFP
jgi:hypothetical protein